MSDSPAPVFGSMKWGKGVVGLQPTPLPVIYFDHAPSLSYLNGIVGITLTVSGNVPRDDGGVDIVASVVAHLKCNVPAANALRDALNDALLAAQPVENPEGPAN